MSLKFAATRAKRPTLQTAPAMPFPRTGAHEARREGRF